MWAARITAAVAALIILTFMVGGGFRNALSLVLDLSTGETLMMISFLVFWSGLIIGWKREMAGGLTCLFSIAVLYMVDYLFTGSFPRGPYFPILTIPGFLYLYVGIRKRSQ
jgi:hypothetical protein